MNELLALRVERGFGALLLCMVAPLAVSGGADGRAILDKVFGQDRTHSRVLRATLQVFDREGYFKSKRFVEYRIGTAQDSKTLLVFTDPAEIRGLQLLSINRRGDDREQWIMSPATHRARRVAQPDRSERFAGSDFSYEDLSDPVLEDFRYRVLPDARAVNGHPAWLIEAVPVNPERSQYNKVRYWVAKDIPCILGAEMFDAEGRIVRTVAADQISRRSGIWGPRRVEARSLLGGTRSVLTIDAAQFEAGLKENLFTPEAMEAGRIPKSPE